jgi:hypothetical protein
MKLLFCATPVALPCNNNDSKTMVSTPVNINSQHSGEQPAVVLPPRSHIPYGHQLVVVNGVRLHVRDG